MKEYNETDAVKAMLAALPETSRDTVSEDEMLNVLDIIWDWYEDNGQLDLDSEEELDVDALTAHIIKLLAKDKESPITREMVPAIVEAEIAYEATLDE